MASYLDQDHLQNDPEFQSRLRMCIIQEAVRLTPDPLADEACRDSFKVLGWFMPFVSSQSDIIDAFTTGGDAAVTDQMLLSSTQGNWQKVAAVNPPAGA